MKLKYINSDYVPKKQLKGFPLEIIDKMIERQVEQENNANVKVFEKDRRADKYDKGFNWEHALESYNFWKEVIDHENFDLFFEKYPKEKELPLPRVIEVRDSNEDKWKKRVCFMFKNNKAICWSKAKTLKEAEVSLASSHWNLWREIPKEKYKPFDFSKNIKSYSYLLGEKLFSKNGDNIFIINQLIFDDETGKSYINGLTTNYVFEYYTFENDLPAGIMIK